MCEKKSQGLDENEGYFGGKIGGSVTMFSTCYLDKTSVDEHCQNDTLMMIHKTHGLSMCSPISLIIFLCWFNYGCSI